MKDPDAHKSESEKTGFNKDSAGIAIRMQTEVRIPKSQAEGRSKSRFSENTNNI